MKKHFGLCSFLQQANNFVVFDEFWGDEVGLSRDQKGTKIGPGHVAFTGKTGQPKGTVLQAMVMNPARKTHFNPVTWSLHPGVDQ
jgi:hypothetical protein